MTLIVLGIVAAEIAFWVVLFAGLASRTLLRLPRLSAALLALVPVVDLLLLALIAVDLLGGARAEQAHGIGAVYLGFTVAFGRDLIRRVDAWFSYRFAGGPAPAPAPARGPQRRRAEWQLWGRALLAAGIASAVIVLLAWLVGDPERTAAFTEWLPRLWLLVGVWFLAGPLWETLRAPAAETGARPEARQGGD